MLFVFILVQDCKLNACMTVLHPGSEPYPNNDGTFINS